MKVNVIKLEVEGEASEIREALPALLTEPQPIALQPAVPTESAAGIVDVPVVPTPPKRTVDREQVAAELADVAYDIAGEGSLTQPIDDWREIPVDYRWWGDTMQTCHIRKRPGIDLAWCKTAPDKIGHRRMANEMPPAESIAKVCANCNRRITEANRA